MLGSPGVAAKTAVDRRSGVLRQLRGTEKKQILRDALVFCKYNAWFVAKSLLSFEKLLEATAALGWRRWYNNADILFKALYDQWYDLRGPQGGAHSTVQKQVVA